MPLLPMRSFTAPYRRALGNAPKWLARRAFVAGVAASAAALIVGLWLLIENVARQEHSSRMHEVVRQNDNLARLIETQVLKTFDARGEPDISEFTRLYSDLEIGREGVISLVGTDGVVLIRVRDGQHSKGQDVSRSPQFQQMMQSPRGSFEVAGVLDGVARISAYRKLTDKPVFVVVGSALDDVLADVRRRTQHLRQGALLATVIITGVAIWLVCLWGRKQRAEKALRTSDRFLRTLTDIIPGMASYWTPDMHCSFANRCYVEWYGQHPDSILGKHISALLGPEIYLRRLPVIHAAKDGQAQQYECEVTRADGSLGTAWVHYIPDVYQDKVRGFVVWAADLTPIRQAEQKLEQLNTSVRVAAIAFECQEGMVVTDAERVILRVNHAFTSMTGFTSADAVGLRHAELKSARHDEQFDQALWAEVRRVGGWSGELWHRHHCQDDFPVRATVTAVTDPNGSVTHYVFTLVDVTGQREREAQRRQDEQMQRVALVREVHHRIKNNLQGIAGLLRRFEYAHPEVHEAMTQAIGQVQSIAVIHGLQGQGATDHVPIDSLLRAITQTLQELRQSAITLNIPQDWAGWMLVEADAVPIALIVNELILNAIKHSNPPGGPVEIALTQDTINESIRLSILNQGQLSGSRGPQAAQAHMGLSLVASLMPSRGARMAQRQARSHVITTLTLAEPAVTRTP